MYIRIFVIVDNIMYIAIIIMNIICSFSRVQNWLLSLKVRTCIIIGALMRDFTDTVNF